MTYEIFALKYAGPLTSSGAFIMWLKEWEKTVERNCYFWLIRNGSAQIMVDAGVTPELAVKRNLTGYVPPRKLLRQLHLDAADIKHVILTHLHWDHAGGASLFPNARFYVQEEEYRFWLDDPISERPPFKLGSDCAHFFRNYREDWPSSLIMDLAAWMKTYDKLRSRVYDPLMTTRYEKVTEHVTRLA